MQLKPQQQEALNRIEAFLKDKTCNVFILKGYAGTGKTTMISEIAQLISKLEKNLMLMAPTGRAAKILHEKTGLQSNTIHKTIYSQEKFIVRRHDEKGKLVDIPTIKNDEKESRGIDELHFHFKINDTNTGYDPSSSVVIVDESSMISSTIAKGEYLHFGTDILLDDLLTFVKPLKGAKIIFVGDPAQLPPIGDNKSAALDESYFLDKGLSVESYELSETIRQSGESMILKNAMMIRDLLASEKRTTYVFERHQGEVEDILPDDAADKFFEEQPIPEIGNSIIVCYSNAKVKEYNDNIREKYFPGNKGVMPGDVLQIVRNNYNLENSLYNGDFVKVLEVSGNVESHAAPVWISRNGERKRVTISVDYRKVKILAEDGKMMDCYLIENLLNSPSGSLSTDISTSMYIDFLIRHDHLRKNTDDLKSALRTDPYFNAIHAKYGYAITGHKSQGGEWTTVYVDFTDRRGTNNDCLRWSYTATTRASKYLYGINFPHVTPLSRFTINSDINRISKPNSDAISLANPDCDLMPDARPFQKVKCNSVKADLSDINCKIISVLQLPYRDRYTVGTPEGEIKVDCLYNKAGIYTSVNSKDDIAFRDAILEIFNRDSDNSYAYDYTPPFEALRILHNKIESVCDELSIKITNVIEKSYCVTYFLKTSGKYSYLQCYYNNDGFVTNAIPSSDLGNEDNLLISLIKKLK